MKREGSILWNSSNSICEREKIGAGKNDIQIFNDHSMIGVRAEKKKTLWVKIYRR